MQTKKTINSALKPYLPFVSGLANILGGDCEVLLHDTSIPEGSVVACANTHVTGREIGAPMTAFGRQLMQSEKFSDRDGIYNYHAMTEDGRRLKCSVIYLRDKKNKLIGLICVNIDVSRMEQARKFLDEFINPGKPEKTSPDIGISSSAGEMSLGSAKVPPLQDEKFYRGLDDVWAHLFQELRTSIDAPLERLSPAELQSVIAKLDQKGFFLIKGSINFLAKELGKSRYTIYGYLKKLKSDSADVPENQ